MIGKSYTLKLDKIKEIYDALSVLEATLELKIDAVTSYRLGRLKTHLSSPYKTYIKERKDAIARLRAKGKIEPQEVQDIVSDLLEEEYEDVKIPELNMSSFMYTVEDGSRHLAVPQKLINALAFHIKDDVGSGDKETMSEPTRIRKKVVPDYSIKEINEVTPLNEPDPSAN